MTEDKFVYRVYTSFHADDESLVFEYGIYSTFEKAQERLKAVLTKKGGQWKWSRNQGKALRIIFSRVYESTIIKG